jgi:tetraacyldisaccharide-1-P 4'-kinase
VVFVGHAYRANPGERARIVRGDDALEEVGDEALVAAQELHDAKVPVVVGRSRQLAVTFAARLADVVVVDGLLQSSPRATLALLAVDAREPWGRAQAMPPCGDLRAPMAALLSAADRIVRIGDGPSSCDAHADSSGAWVGGHLLTWDNLAKLRVGLVTALARPDRIRRSLERRGVRPVAFVAARDHSPIEARALQAAPPVDLWIATRKCGLGARRALRQASRPSETAGAALGVLDHTLVLGLDLTRELARLDPGYLGQ